MERTNLSDLIERIERFRIYRDIISGSTNVKAMKWDSITKDLVIQFGSGATYTYESVPEAIYNNVMDGNAGTETAGPWGPIGKFPSVGAAVHQFLVQGGFTYRRGGTINF